MVKFAMFKGRSKNSKFQMGKKFKFQGKIFRMGEVGKDLWTVTKYSQNSSEVTCNDNSQSIVLELLELVQF